MARQMKDSGVEWVGEIPEEWSINRVKYVCTEVLDQLPATTAPDYEFDYVDISSVTYDNGIINKEAMSFSSAPSRARRIVRLGDIIFSTVRTYLKAIALIGEQDENVIVSTGFAVYRSISTDRRFLFYAMQNHSFVSTIEAHSTGVSYPAIASSKISSFHIVLPSSTDQRRIADYLDAKCAEIDKVVEKTRETIEEYKKLKQSIITETVTKGLNPDAEMKDSGIPWIGKIPVEWSIERLQWHLREINHSNNPVQTRQILSLTNKLGVIPYETKGNIGNKSKEDYSDYKLAYPDTIVVNSMNVIIGSVGISNYFGCVSPVYYVFAPETGNNVRFLNYIFQTTGFQKELRCYANGILEIRLRVSSDKILKRGVAIPSVEEQKLIVSYLDAKCAELDSIIEKKEQLIEELGSYKKSLIYEYVTGKKDVQA